MKETAQQQVATSKITAIKVRKGKSNAATALTITTWASVWANERLEGTSSMRMLGIDSLKMLVLTTGEAIMILLLFISNIINSSPNPIIINNIKPLQLITSTTSTKTIRWSKAVKHQRRRRWTATNTPPINIIISSRGWSSTIDKVVKQQQDQQRVTAGYSSRRRQRRWRRWETAAASSKLLLLVGNSNSNRGSSSSSRTTLTTSRF